MCRVRLIKATALMCGIGTTIVVTANVVAQSGDIHEVRVSTPKAEYASCEAVAPRIDLKAGNATQLVDGWIWVNLPDGSQAYLGQDLKTFFSTAAPALTNFTVTDLSQTLLEMPLPANLPAGRYTMLAMGVVPAANPWDPANQVTNLATAEMQLVHPDISGPHAATLSWLPPTTNVDGTATVDLAGYRIYFGTTSDCYLAVIDVANPGVASYMIENLAPSTYYFAVTAYAYSGAESPPSEIVSVVLGGP